MLTNPPTINPIEALLSLPCSPSVYAYRYRLVYYIALFYWGVQVGLQTQRLSLVGFACAWLHNFKETFC